MFDYPDLIGLTLHVDERLVNESGCSPEKNEGTGGSSPRMGMA